jgi:putative acetyltransferase
MITFRTEKLEDLAAIREVHLQAFSPSLNEAYLVDLLRKAGKALVSLVTLSDGQIVGHVLFSPVTIDPGPPGTLRGLGIAPIGVLPAFQRQGVGTKLIEHGLRDCERGGYDLVVVLGDPRYYSRFGFARAKAYELENEYGADEAFRVLELRPGVLRGVSGTVKYQPEFREAEC